MRSFIPFFFVMLHWNICLFAQTPHFGWAKRIGGTAEERGNSAAIDKDGNILITGSFQNAVDFDPSAVSFLQSSNGGDDIFIQKLDQDGNLLWAKTIGSSRDDRGYSIETDMHGNVYVVGIFGGTVDFDPGPSAANITGDEPADSFILKLSGAGDFLWVKNFQKLSANGLALDSSGNIYSIGYSINKFAPDGELLWSFDPNSYSGIIEGYDIETDVNGSVYATGRFSGTVDFDPSATEYKLTSTSRDDNTLWSDNDVFVSKYDGSGKLLWAKQMGGRNRDTGYGLKTDKLMNVYVTGVYYRSGDFDPGAGTFELTNNGASDLFIEKLDASGNFIWAWGLGSTSYEVGESIALDKNGNVYVTGNFNESIALGPDITLTSKGTHNQFIATLDHQGNFIWAKSMGGASYTTGNCIVLGETGNVYTVGIFYESSEFDFESSHSTLISSGGGDIFISSLSVTDMPDNSIPVVIGYVGEITNLEEGFELTLSDFQIEEVDNTPDDNTLIVLPGPNYTVSGTTIKPDAGFSGPLTITIMFDDGNYVSEPFEFTVTVNGTILSVDEIPSVYPNSSTNFFYFKGDKFFSQALLFDIKGDLVFNKNLTKNEVDVSGISQGHYILKLVSVNGKHSTYRVVIK